MRRRINWGRGSAFPSSAGLGRSRPVPNPSWSWSGYKVVGRSSLISAGHDVFVIACQRAKRARGDATLRGPAWFPASAAR
jgi:hypothetical protein